MNDTTYTDYKGLARTGIIDLPSEYAARINKNLTRARKRYRVHGNLALLDDTDKLWHCPLSLIAGLNPAQLDDVEKQTENAVLDSKILVTAIASPANQRAAVVPLRWGAPRVLVLSCGIKKALGEDLKEEPFRAARLWRYAFDPTTDLVISCSEDDSGWTAFSETVHNLIRAIAPHHYHLEVN